MSSVFAEPAPAVRDNTPSFVPSEDLLRFVVQVVNGESQELRGVFVDRVLALAVVQQPPGDYLYVSANLGTITEFQSAALHGATGLLAHNYLSGALFFNLKVDQEVGLIFGDGRVQRYRISEILSFQKLGDEQSSPYLNIETGEVFDTKELFSLMYTQADRVTFQTCIKKGSDWSWGRIFIVAEPVL